MIGSGSILPIENEFGRVLDTMGGVHIVKMRMEGKA